MRYVLTFLAGALVGAGGTFLWLRKDIRERQEATEKAAELPFTMGDNETRENMEKSTRSDSGASEGHSEQGSEEHMATSAQTRVEYHKIMAQVKDDNPVTNDIRKVDLDRQTLQIPLRPRDDVPMEEDPSEVKRELLGYVPEDLNDAIFEIDMDDFMNDDDNEKQHLVFFQGDQIMATEEGSIITNPAILVGTEWNKYVGNYATKTAFVRNPRLVTDYEIYVEEGLYTDEYGPYDIERED